MLSRAHDHLTLLFFIPILSIDKFVKTLILFIKIDEVIIMFIKFLDITFSNALSYGNKPTTISFKNGMTFLTGKNGCGKSVLLDVLSFCLYGIPFRKIKIDELINRRNKKSLLTQLNFEISDDSYCITRGLKPSILKITKNGEPLELLSTKKLTQSEIDKIIGIDHDLFRQIISISISHNKPFISLNLAEKRDVIEGIFGIKIFGEMSKIHKRDVSNNKTQLEISKKTIEMMENNIRVLMKQVKDAKVIIQDFDKNKENDIKNINDKINKYQSEIDGLEKKCDEIRLSYIEVDDNEIYILNSDIDDITKKYNDISYLIKSYKDDVINLTDKSFCNSCKQIVDGVHRKKEIEKLGKMILDESNNLKSCETHLSSLKDKRCILSEQIEVNRNIYTKVCAIKEKISLYKSEMDSLKIDIDTIQNRRVKIDLNNLQSTLETKKAEYIDTYKSHKEFLQKFKLNDSLTNILSDSGIKSYFFNKLIPLLNTKVNEILNKFDIPLQITFNNMLEEEIYNYTNGNYIVNYFSLSEGEKKRIDIAILLAFITITKIINNWQCNLILMDEVLDSSVDGDGLDKMVESLRVYSNSVKSCCVYLISHRQIDSDYFNYIHTVYKNDGFSEIKIKTV